MNAAARNIARVVDSHFDRIGPVLADNGEPGLAKLLRSLIDAAVFTDDDAETYADLDNLLEMTVSATAPYGTILAHETRKFYA